MAQARTDGIDIGKAIADALIAGLVALGMFAPIIGLVTVQNISNQLVLETRWGLVAILVGLVMIGRFLIATVIWPAVQASKRRKPRVLSPSQTSLRQTAGRLAAFALLGFVLVYPFVMLSAYGSSGAIKWIDNFGIQILIYIMLGWGLNIVVGLAGLLDLGYVAFYAVGAYSYALLAQNGLPFIGFSGEYPYIHIEMIQLGQWAFWVLLPISGCLAALWGVILGFPVLRLRGDYLAIVTLAFGEIIRLVLINWKSFSNGYEGISGVVRPSFFGAPFNASDDGFVALINGWLSKLQWLQSYWPFNNFDFQIEYSPIYRTIFLFYLILALALLTAYVTLRLRRLPVGRAWEALREDEIACRSLGINTTTTKLTAFATGAMFGGFAGAFFAARQGFISPESFIFHESAIILAIVVLGGMGSLIGVVISAVVMIGGTELMRELDVLKQVFGNDFDPTKYRMLLFGLAMVLIMLWKPRGLISHRAPTAFLRKKKAISADLVQEGHG